MEWVIILAALTHLLLTPFTKVEESFNIQAVHDILYHGVNISKYDHLEFPGVVPRTFIGPVFLAVASAPFVFLAESLQIGTKFLAQYIVRAALCLSVVCSLILFARTLKTHLGKNFSWWYLLVSASQYHLLFYSSRPLPNILALPLTLLALHAVLSPRRKKWFIIFSGAAIIWFRTELALLLGIILLMEIIDGRIKPYELLKIAVPTAVILVLITLVVDSFFWQRLVWPEAEVFYFNVVLNKSKEWGTSPFLWYFYSATPRGLATSIFLIPFGLYWEQRVRRLVLASLIFILCFSFLPHKELRFIIYTFPLLNTAVAAACQRMWENRRKSPFHLLMGLGAASHVAINVVFTIFLLMVARINYPGGLAISRLHELLPSDQQVYVHIENLAAQTGVTRFTEINENWRYSKVENLTRGNVESMQFTHLIVEAKSKYSPNLKPYSKSHKILESVDGFAEIAMNYQLIPPVRIKTKPLLFILERDKNVAAPDLEERADDLLDEYSIEEEDYSSDTEKVTYIENLVEENDDLFEYEEPVIEKAQEATESAEKETDNEYSTNGEGYEYDDLLAMETRDGIEVASNESEEDEENTKNEDERQSVDFDNIVRNLEEKLNSGEVSDIKEDVFNQILLEKDVLDDIKMLTNIDFDNSPSKIEKLKEALKIILKNYKEHVMGDTPVDEELDDLKNKVIVKTDDGR